MWNVFTDILWSAITVFVPTRVSAFRHKPYHMKSRDLRKCAAIESGNYGVRCVEIPLTLKLVLSIDSVYTCGVRLCVNIR